MNRKRMNRGTGVRGSGGTGNPGKEECKVLIHEHCALCATHFHLDHFVAEFFVAVSFISLLDQRSVEAFIL